MWNNFFKHIDIDPNNAHILDGNALDLQAECDAFEKKIEEAGGIELFVGGMGKCSSSDQLWLISGLNQDFQNFYLRTFTLKHRFKRLSLLISRISLNVKIQRVQFVVTNKCINNL